MKKYYLFLSAGLIISVSLLLNCSSTNNEIPSAVKGEIDLLKWNFEKKTIQLDGEWELVWGKLVPPEEMRNKNIEHDRCFIKIPGKWNGLDCNGKILSGTGFATFSLNIKIPEPLNHYALKIQEISTAYRLWIDGKLIANIGTVHSDSKKGEPRYIPIVVSFIPDKENIHLVMQVSNFHDNDGGILYGIKLGHEEKIFSDKLLSLSFDILNFSILFIMGLFHLMLYRFRKKELSSLYFALFSIIIAVRTIVTGERFINILFPDFPWSASVKIEQIAMCIGIPAIMTFFLYLYPKEVSKKIVRLQQIIGLAATLFFIVTPFSIGSNLIEPYEILLIAAALYLSYVLVIAIINRREGSIYIAIGGFAIIIAAINDALNDFNIIYTGNFIMVGQLIFILSMTFVLLKRFSGSFNRIETLSDRLKELDIIKDKLLRKYEESMMNILQERLNPHFLFNGIHAIQSIMHKDVREADDAIIVLADIYRFLMDKSFNTMIDFDEEWEFVKNFLIFEKIRYGANFSYQINKTGDFKNIQIPPLTIQPLVENSIKHGIRKKSGTGNIRINADITLNEVIIAIIDNGAGIHDENVYSKTIGKIRDRLKFHFEKSEIEIINLWDGGARSVVRFTVADNPE